MKQCPKCKQSKLETDFWKNKKSKDGLQIKCKPCHTLAMDKNVAKNSRLLKMYGISLNEYEEIAKTNDYNCVICDKKCPSGRKLAVDHDHKTGLIRGLLCINCNKGIGNFKDNVELLKEAIQYLEFFKNNNMLEGSNASYQI